MPCVAQKYNQAHTIVFEMGWSDSSKKLDKQKKKRKKRQLPKILNPIPLRKVRIPITSISHFLIFSSIFYDYPSSQVKGFVSILFLQTLKQNGHKPVACGDGQFYAFAVQNPHRLYFLRSSLFSQGYVGLLNGIFKNSSK